MTRRVPLRLGSFRVSRGMQGIHAGHEVPAPICFEGLRACTGDPERPALASASITVRPHLAQVWGSTATRPRSKMSCFSAQQACLPPSAATGSTPQSP